jgi:hypothetical protein
MTPLAIYLRNHEAAAQAGLDLARRTASSQGKRDYAVELSALVLEIRADLDTLRELMRRFGVQPDPALGLLLRVGERLGRLKPNGHLLHRAPLSDLIEIEGMLDAVRAKAAGWQALAAREDNEPEVVRQLADLLDRADSQVERLSAIHRVVAAQVLTRS